jgi:hypothetical protein
LAVVIIGVLLFLILTGRPGAQAMLADRYGLGTTASGEPEHYLCLIVQGQLVVLTPDPILRTLRPTSIPRQAAQSPESALVDIALYEGRTVLVEGYADSGWLYEARVIDLLSPFEALVVRYAY